MIDLLEQRKETHGDFHSNSFISQTLKGVVRPWIADRELTSAQREAIDMILHKISRICAGNPDHADHWRDIAGYANLVVKNLNNKEV